jgi:Leo1-like protein
VRRRGPSHKRAVVDMPRAREHLTLMQLPPAIDVPLTPSNPVKDPLPQNALTTIMYRLRKGVTRAQVESAMEERGTLRAMPMIAESNTRLVTWSDGSRTLMVGDEHFSVMDDKQTPESLYVFRKGKDVQSYYGQVGKYVRVQPSMVSKKRNSALLALSGGAEANSKGRTMLRQIDGLDEKEAKARHEAAIKRSREQSRRQAKQRRISERAVHPEARLTRRALEDDDDDDDEEEEDADFGRDRLRNRWEEERGARKREEEREARLRESKRAAAAEERVDVVRRRKLGSRRVVDDNDDDDDDDDDED